MLWLKDVPVKLLSLNGSQTRRAHLIFYFSVSPQYLFSEFTKDLIAARKEFCEACDVESDSEENNNKLPIKRRRKNHIFTPHKK